MKCNTLLSDKKIEFNSVFLFFLVGLRLSDPRSGQILKGHVRIGEE